MARILLISDVHGNIEALEASLAAAPSHDHIWNLGDIVGYGGAPNQALELCRSLGTVFVRGNHDKACAGLVSTDDFNPVAAVSAHWTRRELSAENLAWLTALPQGPASPAKRCQIVHGSPANEDEYILSLHDARHAPVGDIPVTFFGHTHVQGGFVDNNHHWSELYNEQPTTQEMQRWDLPLLAQARYLINPGSVGQPRDGDWRAAFALWDSAAQTVSYYRVPYDIARAQQRIRSAGMPEWLASRLGKGR